MSARRSRSSSLGLVLANDPVSAIDVNVHGETLRSLAEVTLALLLFSDAARVNLRVLRQRRRRASCDSCSSGSRSPSRSAPPWPCVLFPDLDPWAAAVIAAAVAPTDAALGAQVVEDEHVPAPHSPDPQRRERAERRHRNTVRDLLHRRRSRRHGDALVDQRSAVPSPIWAIGVLVGAAVGLGGGLLYAQHESRAGRPRRIAASAVAGAGALGVRAWRSSSEATDSSARSSAVSPSEPWSTVPNSRSDARVRLPERQAPLPRRLVPLRGGDGDGARRGDVADRGLRRPRAHRGAHGAGRARADRRGVHPHHGRVHGLVRPSGPGVGRVRRDRLRLGAGIGSRPRCSRQSP